MTQSSSYGTTEQTPTDGQIEIVTPYVEDGPAEDTATESTWNALTAMINFAGLVIGTGTLMGCLYLCLWYKYSQTVGKPNLSQDILDRQANNQFTCDSVPQYQVTWTPLTPKNLTQACSQLSLCYFGSHQNWVGLDNTSLSHRCSPPIWLVITGVASILLASIGTPVALASGYYLIKDAAQALFSYCKNQVRAVTEEDNDEHRQAISAHLNSIQSA